MLLKTVFGKTYGVGKVACTHAPLAVLTASGANRADHDIRYHSLYDNTYLRFFKVCAWLTAGWRRCEHTLQALPLTPCAFSAHLQQGHTSWVTSLAMSPKSDAFLTASQDGTCRLWDVRTNVCSGALRCSTTSPVAAFDHQGLVFAVVTTDGVLKMFDAREYDKGPFDVCVFDAGHHPTPAGTTTSISFTLDGKQLLLCSGGHIYVLDAFNGQRLQCIPIPQAAAPSAYALPPPPCEPCFTPDGRCVVSGAPDGLVHIWNAATGAELRPAWRGHAGVPSCLRWSPTRCLAASGCTAGGLALWIPAQEGAQQPGGAMQQTHAAQGSHFAAPGLMAAMQPVMQGGMW